MKTLESVFTIRYGERTYTDKGILDKGITPLIASQGVGNGVHGFYDVPTKYNSPIITVPRTGSIGYAFVQLLPCTVTDDCMVLVPKITVSIEYLFYVAAIIRFSRWRFNYARKITPRRLGVIRVLSYDDFKPTTSYSQMFEYLYPKPSITPKHFPSPMNSNKFKITELFDLERGHFHAIDRLDSGHYPTVSRVSVNNGVVGFYQKPDKAKIFPKMTTTVSTVTGDAFIQYYPFIVTDNVVICTPKKPMKVTTLVYIQVLLNKVKWRYSYGRQCYKGKFEKTVIKLPVTKDDEIDEDYIENLVTNLPYWNEYRDRLIESKTY